MSAIIKGIINELINQLGTNDFIEEASVFTEGKLDKQLQEVINNTIEEVLIKHIEENNLDLTDLPENWREILRYYI